MFPPFLAHDFDEASLDASPSSIAALDKDGVIHWVNRAWQRRAAEQKLAGPLTKRSYFDAIADPLRAFYERAFGHASATQTVFECDYECPTPEEQRTFRLRVLPIKEDGLLVEHSLVAATAAGPGQEALEERYVDGRGFFTQCANCRRVRHPPTQAWHWIPEWVERMSARMSHGICPPCAGYFWGTRRR